MRWSPGHRTGANVTDMTTSPPPDPSDGGDVVPEAQSGQPSNPQSNPQSNPPSNPYAPTPAVLFRGAPVTLVDAVAAGRPVVAARWGIPDFLITWALWLFFSVVGVAMAVGLFGDTDLTSAPGILLALSVPWIGLAGWPILVSLWKGNGPVVDYGLTNRWSDLGWGLVYGAAALLVAGLLAVLTQAVFGEFDSSVGKLADSMDSPALLLVFGVLVAIGAPIAEELAFRGLLFTALAKRGLAPWLVIGISALAFSLFHFEPVRILLLLGTGIVLGLARYHRGSTTTSMVAHAVNNIPAVIALIFASS